MVASARPNNRPQRTADTPSQGVVPSGFESSGSLRAGSAGWQLNSEFVRLRAVSSILWSLVQQQVHWAA